jgi:putative glycosyl hydrolase-like family 15 (GHL15) protein
MFRRVMISALSVLAFAQAQASTQSTPTSPIYPLLGGYLISSPQNYADPTYAANIAKLNAVILSVWPGFTSDGMNMQQSVAAIKKINPNEVVFLYQDINELQPSPAAVWAPVANALNTNHWWLYNSGNSGGIVASSWGNGFNELNTTIAYPPNSSNQYYVDWRAAWDVQQYGPSVNPSIDGFYTDNVFWSPRVNGDWQQNGTSDSDTNPTVQQWYRLGYVRYINDLKSAMPGKYQIGNIADWGQTNAVLTEYNQVLQGGLMEGMIGQSWSFETQGFKQMMAAYQKMMNAIAPPQIVLFAQDDTPTNYQGMRYGLAACLLGNAYYNFNANTAGNSVTWFDEFDANLGAATSAPFPSTPYQNGVYRRDFANGIALVNPKGNGTQTVTLETSYRKLSGTQVPSVNNGQTVTSVTLNDRDGIILMRLSAQAVPAAPTLSVQ